MRISDWSSDVCSSDLPVLSDRRSATQRPTGKRRVRRNQRRRSAWRAAASGFAPQTRAPADRKSVVSGKSVSERVDLGGRVIIKKKTLTLEYNSCLSK